MVVIVMMMVMMMMAVLVMPMMMEALGDHAPKSGSNGHTPPSMAMYGKTDRKQDQGTHMLDPVGIQTRSNGPLRRYRSITQI